MLESILSSRVRAKLLTAFLLSPGDRRHAWELAHSLDESYSAVWKELIRLERIGILASEQTSHAKVYEINRECPIIPELRSIVLKTTGVGSVIRNQLVQLGAVKAAFIYGSYASGEADSLSDLDLMVIGEVALQEFAGVILHLEKELNRPINYLLFSQDEWKAKISSGEPFILNVLQSPKIMLIGDQNAL